MNEFFQSIISKIKTLLNNYQESAAKAGEKTQPGANTRAKWRVNCILNFCI